MKKKNTKSIKKFIVADINKIYGSVRKTSRSGPFGCEGDLKYGKNEWNKTSSEANGMNVVGGRDYNIC